MRRNYLQVQRYRFTGRKVPVYGAKGTGLRGERYHFTGRKAPVYGAGACGWVQRIEIWLYGATEADSGKAPCEALAKGTGLRGA